MHSNRTQNIVYSKNSSTSLLWLCRALIGFVLFVEIFVSVWGLGGEWPEFSIAIFSVFSFSSCLFLSFGYSYICRCWSHLARSERLLIAFLLLFVIIAFSQCFVYNLEVIQRETFFRIVSKNISNWIPASVDTDYSMGGALQSFVSIFCAVSAFVFVLLFAKRKNFAVYVLYLLAMMISAAGVFGISQKASHEYYIYGLFYSESSKYGTFLISNTAGAVFNLGTCASLALVYYEITKKNFVAFLKSLLLLVCVGLCVYATFDCESVGALCIVCLQMLLFVMIILFSQKNIKYILITFTVVVCVALSIGSKIANANIKLPNNIVQSIESRVFINSVSFEILKNPRIWGTGGGSYGFYATPVLVEHTKNDAFRVPYSIQRAHNDIVEFVIEYGIMGSIILGLIFILYLFSVRKNVINLTKTNTVILSGVLLCVIHSLVDLHLHVMSALIIVAFFAALGVANFKGDTD